MGNQFHHEINYLKRRCQLQLAKSFVLVQGHGSESHQGSRVSQWGTVIPPVPQHRTVFLLIALLVIYFWRNYDTEVMSYFTAASFRFNHSISLHSIFVHLAPSVIL